MGMNLSVHWNTCKEMQRVQYYFVLAFLRFFWKNFFSQELLFVNPCHAGMPLATQENLHQNQPHS